LGAVLEHAKIIHSFVKLDSLKRRTKHRVKNYAETSVSVSDLETSCPFIEQRALKRSFWIIENAVKNFSAF